MGEAVLSAERVEKAFVLHNQGAVRLPVLSAAALEVAPGECVALVGASGSGKSTFLRMLYGNYGADGGAIVVAGVDLARADPRTVLELRRTTLGYVSQFLRVVPRVAAVDVVAEPAVAQGRPREEAQEAARGLLARLNLPERLWGLSPVTFSGGEQQRVNIARGFIGRHKVLLVDEPTASLDAANRRVVLDLIHEKKAAGVALVGIFHDETVRAEVCERRVDVSQFAVDGAAQEGAG